MVSWRKHRLHSQVPLMAWDCMKRPWKAVGEEGHLLPLLVKATLQASSWYNHSKSSHVPVRRWSLLGIYAIFFFFMQPVG
ncbi:unnamed protein product [Staurois parvus]|uniref:Uncharacterized protein n=1 Tax=Staurois parvus TaxID=386267 RepID=A0ABN9GWP3_9NEOB|nr:unnamed protein product [Staurois parvus]